MFTIKQLNGMLSINKEDEHRQRSGSSYLLLDTRYLILAN